MFLHGNKENALIALSRVRDPYLFIGVLGIAGVKDTRKSKNEKVNCFELVVLPTVIIMTQRKRFLDNRRLPE